MRKPTISTRRAERGVSLIEMLVTMGIVGILGATGLSMQSLDGMELNAAQQELEGSLDQAFALARATGKNVRVSMSDDKVEGHLPVHLPKKLKWGKPAHIPLPPGMDDPKVADESGEAHASITVSPRRTATASAWFLHNGSDAICLRINGHGRVQTLRYRAHLKQWRKA
jgi:prepilin-type N-terminal cleavage/methylation domain-containing protein